MNKKTLRDIDLKGKRVIMRVDFNVPVKDGVIKDDTRIQGALPSIKYVLDNGGKLILMSHMGRPDEKGITGDTTMKIVADYLSKLLGKDIVFVADCAAADAEVAAMKDGDIVMLENTRYHKEEQAKLKQKDGQSDEDFKAAKAALKAQQKELAKKLASYADVYCNDAFGTAHRAHASTALITKYIPVSVAGFLMEKEIEFLGNAVENPIRPFVAILGGAKVSDKLAVVNNLLTKVNTLIIGGGMAYTFLKAMGHNVGNSLCEDDQLQYAKDMIAKAKELGVEFLLPIDNLAADAFSNDANIQIVGQDIPEGWMGLDIGPKTIELYANAIKSAKTVVWNGPMGCFEMDNFNKGTFGVAAAVAEVKANGGISIIGGGDSVSAVKKSGLADKMTHISTGGGASLEYLEGKELPGVAALNDRGRKVFIAGNWKMNKTASEAAELAAALKESCAQFAGKCEVAVCPTFTSLAAVVEVLKGSNVKVGAQNIHWADNGAYTGEISGAMLKEIGVEYVIIGHSERRQYFGETDATVNLRIKAALKYGLKPIVCIGETLEERESGVTNTVLEKQIRGAFADITADDMNAITIAYEPVWAIGTGKTATPDVAQDTHAFIRSVLVALFGKKADDVVVQYGGSMKPGNSAELVAKADIDGGLIGGAALKADSFTELIANAIKG